VTHDTSRLRNQHAQNEIADPRRLSRMVCENGRTGSQRRVFYLVFIIFNRNYYCVRFRNLFNETAINNGQRGRAPVQHWTARKFPCNT